ncbi:MAG: thioredoxin family protein [Proteobacteria bacterium]|nr:thioredoxin family protein [Pseudomonadota bacterium]
MTTPITSSQELQSIIASRPQSAILVYFYGQDCPPCQHISPYVDQVVDVYPNTVSVVKVQGDQAVDLCNHFQVEKLPTILVIFKNEIVFTQVGGDIEAFVNQIHMISHIIELSRRH